MTSPVKLTDAFKMNLRFLMFEKGLSIDDLGKKVDVSRQAVDKMFKSDDIKTSTMGKYAAAFGYEETDLIDPNFKQKYFNKDIK